MTNTIPTQTAPARSKTFIAATVATAMLATSLLVPLGEAQAQGRRGGDFDGYGYSQRFEDHRSDRYERRGRNFDKRRRFEERGRDFDKRRRFEERGDYAQRRHSAPPPVVYHAPPKKKKKNIGKYIAIGAGIAALAIIAGAASQKKR